jgi:tetratricopeptide (TPR) repeat protein
MRLFEARGYGVAQTCFEAQLAEHPGTAAAMAFLGRTYIERRQPRPAIEWLKKAVEAAPNRSDYHDWLGQAYGIAAERAPVVRQLSLAVKTRKEFERAVELDPANLDAVDDLIEFQIEAPPLMGGSLAKARLHAAEVGRRDALRGRLDAAAIASREGGPAAAERELLGVVQEFPNDARPRLALGTAYVQQGAYDKAFETLEVALRLDPDNGEAYHELAKAAMRSGQRLDRAQELLCRYVKRLPAGDDGELADAHFWLGALLERRSDRAGAREHYQAVLRLDPTSDAAQDALRKLR